MTDNRLYNKQQTNKSLGQMRCREIAVRYQYLAARNLLADVTIFGALFAFNIRAASFSLADAISREKGTDGSPLSVTNVSAFLLFMKRELIILTGEHVYYGEAARRADSHININLWVPRATRLGS